MEFKQTGLADIINLKNIHQSYGDKIILENFNLLVEDQPNKGQFVSLLGRSGCGKSTILRYITGTQKPTSGEVLIKGEPLNKNNRVGMVFQRYSSYEWKTVLENVALGLELEGVPKKEREERAMEILKVMGLEEQANKYAKYGVLSGGQLQRVAIARSLLKNPDIIVMDEPFGALDVRTRLQMQELLLGIWEKIQATIILVTHDISEAVYLSDDIYIMSPNGGKIEHHIKPSFTHPRFSDIKRTQEFTNMVHNIENLMLGE